MIPQPEACSGSLVAEQQQPVRRAERHVGRVAVGQLGVELVDLGFQLLDPLRERHGERSQRRLRVSTVARMTHSRSQSLGCH